MKKDEEKTEVLRIAEKRKRFNKSVQYLWCRSDPVFVKLVVAIPNKFHCSYDALLSLGFDSSFERSGLSQTLSGNSQSLVEPVQRSGCLAFANS